MVDNSDAQSSRIFITEAMGVEWEEGMVAV